MSLSFYDPYLKALEAELKEVFAPREGFLYDVLRYHMGWIDQQGAAEDTPLPFHFQSVLALLTCEALSGDFHAALPSAAGIELVLNFVAVHSDVQSARLQAAVRPSVWWIWGPAQAINAGDGLHALGRTTIMRLAQRDVPADRVLRAVASLDRACLTMCEGQYMDLEFQDQLMVTSHAYYDMIRRKTAALAECSAELGAIAAGGDDGVCEAFREIGATLAMAWQINQDVADLWGQHGDGMTPSNVLDKKKSLPLIHALENAPISSKRELGNIYMKRVLQPEDVAQIITILDESGSRQFSLDKARELAQQAIERLDGSGLAQERLMPLRLLCQQELDGGTHG